MRGPFSRGFKGSSAFNTTLLLAGPLGIWAHSQHTPTPFWVALLLRRRFRRKMRERCMSGGGLGGHLAIVVVIRQRWRKLDAFAEAVARSPMERKWSHHFGRQFCCRSAGPYIGRRRRLKGMEEGRKGERRGITRTMAACLPPKERRSLVCPIFAVERCQISRWGRVAL